MGIVDLWKTLSLGEKKITLEALSTETAQKNKGRGLRVAIDAPLWVFQSRASVVGEHSELRSMFFRFCRLYHLGIRPVFVFDGINKPTYKRNKILHNGEYDRRFTNTFTQLIKLFNFSTWNAYGDAEAECVMLERLGYVDMILTGDSDSFLFGARRVIRQWPQKRNEPVSCYDMTWITDATKLDRSDLILIALLRGSDYDTQGTKGVGIKVAEQLSRCHFHRGIMDDMQVTGRDYPIDDEKLGHLFDDLTYELHHNNTKNLSRKNTAITLDSKFFDFSLVVDFIHPITNIASKRKETIKLAKELNVNLLNYVEPDWSQLAHFCQYHFQWSGDYVLKRFSSLLYCGYMANRLRRQQSNYRKIDLNDTSPSSSSSSQSKTNTRLQQTTLDRFYKSTSRHHLLKEPDSADIIEISLSKTTADNLQLYRIEWNKSTWVAFQNIIKTRLDFTLFLNEPNEDDLEEVVVETTASKGEEKDTWSQIKRQWVDATHVHNAYPTLALEYKDKISQRSSKKKNISSSQSSSQTKLDSFLYIPPKRNTAK